MNYKCDKNDFISVNEEYLQHSLTWSMWGLLSPSQLFLDWPSPCHPWSSTFPLSLWSPVYIQGLCCFTWLKYSLNIPAPDLKGLLGLWWRHHPGIIYMYAAQAFPCCPGMSRCCDLIGFSIISDFFTGLGERGSIVACFRFWSFYQSIPLQGHFIRKKEMTDLVKWIANFFSCFVAGIFVFMVFITQWTKFFTLCTLNVHTPTLPIS